jgi:Icc-related predicted phosphoesterase
MLRKLIPWSIIGALALGGVGCKDKDSLESKVQDTTPVVRTINGQDYRFEGNKVTQLTSDEDNQARYGVISDPHGEVEKARAFAQKFKEMGVDGIIVPGDVVNNERFSRRGKKWNDAEETTTVLEAIAETGLPVYVISGNHDITDDYNKGLSKVTQKHLNVIDMNKYRVVDGDDADLVSLPGYTNRRFTAPGALYADPDFVRKTGKLADGLDDSVVLIAHGAGKTNTDGKPGPATIYRGDDVGDPTTTQMMKKNGIPFAVVGNIHEAGGLAATHVGTPVKQGEWSKQFTANFGGLEKWKHLDGKTYDGMAGVLTVKGDQAKFEMIYLN